MENQINARKIKSNQIVSIVFCMFFLLGAMLVTPHFDGSYGQAIAAEKSEASGMERMQLILKKLRSTMASMKDFDDLEEAGMAKVQVDRMRKAMTQKIQQLTDDAVGSIRDL